MGTKNVVIFLLVDFHAWLAFVSALLMDTVWSVLATLTSAALYFVFLLFQGCVILDLGVVGWGFVKRCRIVLFAIKWRFGLVSNLLWKVLVARRVVLVWILLVTYRIIVVIPMLSANRCVITVLLWILVLEVLFIVNVVFAANTFFIVVAHHTHWLFIRIVSSVHVIGHFLAIVVVFLLFKRVVSLILRFVIIVVCVLVTPSERKWAGSSWRLDDSFIGFAVKVCVVSDVPVNHGNKGKE